MNYDIYQKRLKANSIKDAEKSNNLIGLTNLSNRLETSGGSFQQDRMIEGKRKSMLKSLWSSYQAVDVKRDNDEKAVRVLLNPNRLNQDYDEKVLSVDFDYEFKCGDVFEWLGTNTYWIIYLQQLSELAYFRGNVRKCTHSIEWLDNNGEKRSTYVALRGPVEQSLNTSIKHAISVDSPNYTLSMLIPNNEFTAQYFTRYRKFYLQSNEICWRIEAIDNITSPGVIEVYAAEYFANDQEDADGIVGSLIEKPQISNSEVILGDTFIKTKKKYTFIYTGDQSPINWQFDKKYPIEYEIDNNQIHLRWTASYSGQFILSVGEDKKTIIVESLF